MSNEKQGSIKYSSGSVAPTEAKNFLGSALDDGKVYVRMDHVASYRRMGEDVFVTTLEGRDFKYKAEQTVFVRD